MCSVRALQDWCRDVCEVYSDVQITDMSSSFTDGLAFCAIIHKHRPDILNFHSLSKHNVYENLRLAFVVAERELGIPALLDPDELMCVEEPDLLSIITYVSQLYCVFNGKPLDSQTIPVKAEPCRTIRQEQTHTQFSSDGIRSSDKSVCSVCHTRVHLIQRVFVKGHLYHRSCFRCSRCRRSLLPMSFTEDSETGLLQCSYQCKPVPEHDRPTERDRDRSETNRERSETDRDRSETNRERSETNRDRSETDRDRSEMNRDRSETDRDRSETNRDRSATDRDRSEMNRDRSETNRDRSETNRDRSEMNRDQSETNRDRSEMNRDRSETNRDRSETDRDRRETNRDRSETEGDRRETNRDRSETNRDRSETDRDRSEMNRDRSETNRDRSETDRDRRETNRDRSETEGDSEMDGDVISEHLSTSSEIDKQEPPKPAPRKRVEPQEPACPASKSQDRQPDKVSYQRVVRKDHPWRKIVEPGPWYRLPPTQSAHSRHCPATFNPFLEDDEDKSKDEEQNPLGFKTSVAHKPQASSSVPSMHQDAAPAHGFPLIKRKVSTDTLVSEKEVCKEQKELQEHLLKLEKRGVQMEREMRRRTDENLLVDWFILIHKKNMLVRRDAELVYMLRQHRLEQQQTDVEFELRCLFNKPEQDWSSDDRQQEHQLMSHLLSIIQQRNDIISSLDLDRQREEEEDMMLSAVIQRTDLLAQKDQQLDKFNRTFKGLQMFKTSSCKTKNSSRKKSS
ncbi:MICAL-like protein 1 [Pimephales promelas]|uniref:MICAL-like protein 1 n=1 Tax=Pimephales promelas TaxID=90988 RepID=UPI00195559DE|nr:MICAL-like protein 1 [Pimephales promelas]KAG1960614.1 MICAL-like protein [Pimephales promelas]